MMTMRIDDFEKFAEYCKFEGVTFNYARDLYNNTVCIQLSKDGYSIEQKIEAHVLENNLYLYVLQETLAKLKKHIIQQDIIQPIVMSGANSRSIVMDEIATTAQKFSDNDIARIGDLKRRAKSLMSQVFAFYGVIDKTRMVLAGGCFTSWYHGESPKDHDVFILGSNGAKINPAEWPEQRYKIGNADYLNAMNLNAKIDDVILDKQTNIQYIVTRYKTREELIKHFDVEHSCVSYVPSDDKLYISPLTFDCIKNKKLMAHNGKIAHWRIHKFSLKGFTVENVSV